MRLSTFLNEHFILNPINNGFFHDLRYTQPPTDLWDWFEPFLDDEEVCQRAGSASSGTLLLISYSLDLMSSEFL